MAEQNVPLLSRVVLLHAMVFGVILAGMQIYGNVSLPDNKLSMAAPAYITQQPKPEGTPVEVRIPRINIRVAVIRGRYDTATQSWDLTPDKAQYFTGTTPNLTVIYGHNTKEVFELTNSLQVGDTLEITSSTGTIKKYRFVSDTITAPNDTSALTASYAKPTVALLTCNGFWSQDRRFMFFEPLEAQE